MASLVVTDGPFLEAKEYLGGYYLIDCENKERAIELRLPRHLRTPRSRVWASKCGK